SLGYKINYGFDLVINGNLPSGGGLSSSAALLVLTTRILKDLMNLDITDIEIAKISKDVENKYIGVQCGIMDQFIIANGKKNNAIYLESSNLDFEYIPCDMKSHKFVLINSNVTRKLTDSKYNTRQVESQEVLGILKKHVDINHICDLSPTDYAIYEKHIDNNDLKKRFEHLVNEQLRVKQAKQALIDNDFDLLGKLLYKAHISAKDLYQVSNDKLDELVEMGMDSGSLGSKMIGGGFGGSTLNLIESCNWESFLNTFTIKYKKRFGSNPIINIVDVVDGVREII
ncbi:MAG: galactokinase, partial [Tenericutes bacterium]|nr:galactokinase [Mycoplasmatota bacterium]